MRQEQATGARSLTDEYQSLNRQARESVQASMLILRAVHSPTVSTSERAAAEKVTAEDDTG